MSEVNEVWKDIPGYEGAYQVSDLGRVRSVDRIDSGGGRRKGRVLRPAVNRDGYLRVVLCRRGEMHSAFVHRLVGVAFLAAPVSRLDVNHLDGDRANNGAVNLEWSSTARNSLHSWRVLQTRARPIIGEPGCGGSPVRFVTQGQAAEALGVSPAAISQALHGKTKSSAGYRWSYA